MHGKQAGSIESKPFSHALLMWDELMHNENHLNKPIMHGSIELMKSKRFIAQNTSKQLCELIGKEAINLSMHKISCSYLSHKMSVTQNIKP